MARTQKNKATSYHLGLLKAKLAKFRRELLTQNTGGKGGGGGGEGEFSELIFKTSTYILTGFDVTKSGDARVGLVGNIKNLQKVMM